MYKIIISAIFILSSSAVNASSNHFTNNQEYYSAVYKAQSVAAKIKAAQVKAAYIKSAQYQAARIKAAQYKAALLKAKQVKINSKNIRY